MGSFTDAIPEILKVLGDTNPVITTSRSREFPSGTFAAVLLALFDRLTVAPSPDRIMEVLGEAGMLDPTALARLEPADLADLLPEFGLRLSPTDRFLLIRFADWFAKTDVESMSAEAIRDALRTIKGIGPATGDALLLHGFGQAAYPVDRPTYRILVRHGWIDATTEYDDARSIVESATGGNRSSLLLLSQEFEAIGKKYCRVAAPRCERCPLRPFLPDSGPCDPSG